MKKQTIHVQDTVIVDYLYEIYKDAFYVLIKDGKATTIDLTTGKHKTMDKKDFLSHVNTMFVYEDENELRRYLIKKSLGEENV